MAVLSSVADRMSASVGKDPRSRWLRLARPSQLLPPLSDPWRVTYFQGGRGSGKTRAGAQALADWCLTDDEGEGEYGIIAPTYADAWTKCVEGKAGILKALGTSMAEIKDHRSRTVKHAWRTYGQVILHNGITVYIDSAAEGGLRIQGRNLKGAWADEIGLWDRWETAWDESLKYAVRDGISRIIATGTPKASRPARKLVRRMIKNDPAEGGVVVRRLRTIDNAKNLSDAFLRAVVGAAQGTRLERQELEGELLDDVANALWTRDLLDAIRVAEGPEYLTEVKIGVDPSDGSETSDEQAYTVVGLGPVMDGHLYVTENWGGQEAPVPFAERVIRRAIELDAELIIEKNHGGAWLGATFQQVMRQMGASCKYRMIHASHAKRTRAEPVSALYAEHGGRVLHVHPADGKLDPHLAELEDQMATFTGGQGERSPDRLDSLVWACTPFLRRSFGPPGPHGVRRWAAARELEAAGAPPNHLALRRLATAHGGTMGRSQLWDLDSFAPQNSADGWDTSDTGRGLDSSEHADYTDGRPWGGRPGRSNVRLWQ